ncbi:MAG TPA: isoamylase early set domain-containing protein [Egibacteraceae bacterium]|nr:isoamylase early set domain-containing protein [Egibacteraceae bacterium]
MSFHLPAEGDGNVSVVGDFNDWTPGVTPLRVHRGDLTASVTVDAGRRYAFRYLGEDGRWFNDEDAPGYEENGFGGTNAVVDLEDGLSLA